MEPKKKKQEEESDTVFDRQEDAWFDNNCQGSPSDYWEV